MDYTLTAFVLAALATVLYLEIRIMALIDDLKAEVARTNESLTNIADDIRRLADRVTGGISDADATALKADLTALADRAAGIAAETPDA